MTRKQRGRGYGFGGSILTSSSSNAGNPLWNTTAGSDCGMPGRGGNNTLAGGKRRRRKTRHRRGGASVLALQQPRAGYTFDGSGVAGTPDPVPSPSYTTYV